MFKNKSVMIIGEGDLLETKLCFVLLQRYPELKRLIIYSRNKEKQEEMQRLLPYNRKIKYCLGGVLQRRKLMSLMRGVDYLLCLGDYPAVKDSYGADLLRYYLNGTENIIQAALARNVEKVLVLSSEKACNPIDMSGTAKLCVEKLILAAGKGKESAGKDTKFSILRYGKAINGAEGLVTRLRKQAENGCLYLEDINATRFWFTIDHCVTWLIKALMTMEGGEVFVPQTPSLRMMDLAQVICPLCQIKQMGIEEGHKLHELLITEEEGYRTKEFPDHYLITEELNQESQEEDDDNDNGDENEDKNKNEYGATKGRPVFPGFLYSSATNYNNLNEEELSILVLHRMKREEK